MEEPPNQFAYCHFAVREDLAPQDLLDHLSAQRIFYYKPKNHGKGIHRILKLSYFSQFEWTDRFLGGATEKDGSETVRLLHKFVKEKMSYDDVPETWNMYTRAVLQLCREKHFQILASEVPVFFDCPLWDTDLKTHTCADLIVRDTTNGHIILIEVKVGSMGTGTNTNHKFFEGLEDRQIIACKLNKHHLQLYFTGKALEDGGIRIDRKILINSNWKKGERTVAEAKIIELAPWAHDIPRQNIKAKREKTDTEKFNNGHRREDYRFEQGKKKQKIVHEEK